MGGGLTRSPGSLLTIRRRNLSMPRALVISPRFFGYEQEIASELGRQGFQTDFIDERPGNGAMMRALCRASPRLASYSIRKYYEMLWRTFLGVAYDLILVIKGEVVPTAFLDELRKRSPSAVFALYTFDSLRNSPRAANLRRFFDFAYSFDMDDATPGSGFLYKPLFHTAEFESARGLPKKYDLSFVGTMHSDRYQTMRGLLRAVPSHFMFLHVQARWYFWLKKLTDRRWRGLRESDVEFGKLSLREVAGIFGSSKGVLDMQRDGQTGLTMRTFEVLAAGAVLVTTNSAIRREALYDEASVYVLSPDKSPADLDTWLAGSRPIAHQAIERYSLRRWVSDLLQDTGLIHLSGEK